MSRCLIAVLAPVSLFCLLSGAPAGEKGVKPVNLDKINTAADEDDPFILPDGKTLLYAANTSGKYRIMQALYSRGWQKGKPLGLGEKENDYRSPFYREGKLYFATNEVPDEKLKDLKNFDIKVSTSGREPLPLLGISEKQDELHPWITRDGREFYFSRKTKQGWMLFVAKGANPSNPSDAKEVGFEPGFHHATLSGSGLVMYLQGPVEDDRAGLFRSKRTSLKGKWSKPEAITALNHPEAKRGDMSPCLSSDGKKLYFVSDRPGGKGGLDIWSVDTAALAKK
jgi:Tol biopolymer transport system component